jgi:hypothetical protein
VQSALRRERQARGRIWAPARCALACIHFASVLEKNGPFPPSCEGQGHAP